MKSYLADIKILDDMLIDYLKNKETVTLPADGSLKKLKSNITEGYFFEVPGLCKVASIHDDGVKFGLFGKLDNIEFVCHEGSWYKLGSFYEASVIPLRHNLITIGDVTYEEGSLGEELAAFLSFGWKEKNEFKKLSQQIIDMFPSEDKNILRPVLRKITSGKDGWEY